MEEAKQVKFCDYKHSVAISLLQFSVFQCTMNDKLIAAVPRCVGEEVSFLKKIIRHALFA
jgi:hypothetical protein